MPVQHDPAKRSALSYVKAACVAALAVGADTRPLAVSRRAHGDSLDLFEAAVYNNASRFVEQRLVGQKPVCIVDLHMPADKVYADLTTNNHRDYAARHDYTYLGYEGFVAGTRFADPPPQAKAAGLCRVHCGGVYFQKLGAMAAAAVETRASGQPLCETMMWVDTDAVFTNFHVPIESVTMHFPEHTPRSKDVILSRENTLYDTSFLNSGVFVVRNTPRGRDFLEGSAALFSKHNVGGDQNAIQEYVFGVDPRGLPMSQRNQVEAGLRTDVGLVDQKVMNAFTWKGDQLSSGSTAKSEWEPCDYIAHVASRNKRDRRILLEQIVSSVSEC